MAIPEAHHPSWADVLTGKRSVEFEFIGARMLVVRLRLTMSHGQAPLPQCCAQLRDVFVKNQELASVQRDLQKLST